MFFYTVLYDKLGLFELKYCNDFISKFQILNYFLPNVNNLNMRERIICVYFFKDTIIALFANLDTVTTYLTNRT